MNTEKSIWAALASSIMAALVSSICCIGPLIIMTLGIGSAWMSNIMIVSAYRPLFIILAIFSLSYSFYKLYLKPNCKIGENCSIPQNLRIQRIIFWFTAFMVIIFIIFPLIMHLLG